MPSTSQVKQLETVQDLDALLQYYYNNDAKELEHLRFGQWVFNIFNIEHKGSYEDKNAFSAYIKLLDYLLLKGE